MLLRRAGNPFSEKKAIGDVPAVAAIISAIGRDAIDALKLVQLKSNRSNRTQSAPDWDPEDHRLSY